MAGSGVAPPKNVMLPRALPNAPPVIFSAFQNGHGVQRTEHRINAFELRAAFRAFGKVSGDCISPRRFAISISD